MDLYKSLFVIVSLSSFLLSIHAFPSTSIAEPPLSPLTSPIYDTNSMYQEFKIDQTKFQPIPEVVVEFCKDTENSTLCAETIAPSLHGSFNPITALETEVEATLNHSTKITSIITESLDEPTTDKRAIDALDICKSQYESIEDTIKECIQLLNQQNVVDAYYKFNSVISYRSACEDAFVESPGVDVPFADDSLTVYQLGGNCMAIMDAIVNNRNQIST